MVGYVPASLFHNLTTEKSVVNDSPKLESAGQEKHKSGDSTSTPCTISNPEFSGVFLPDICTNSNGKRSIMPQVILFN